MRYRCTANDPYSRLDNNIYSATVDAPEYYAWLTDVWDTAPCNEKNEAAPFHVHFYPCCFGWAYRAGEDLSVQVIHLHRDDRYP